MKTLWTILFGILAAINVNAQTPDQTAILGNSSGGGSGGGDPATDLALQRAMDMAEQGGRASPTVEQLLLALLDDRSVQELLAGQSVDLGSLLASLRSYVQMVDASPVAAAQDAAALASPRAFRPNRALQNVFRRALMKNMALNRKGESPTDLLVAILVEGDTFAARALAEHGLTVEEAESASLERYLAVAKEQDAKLADLRRKIAEEPAHPRDPGEPAQSIVASSGTGSAPKTQMYSLRVTSRGAEQARFKGAVSYDGRLDLYIESTPFETAFPASRIAALFEAIDGSLNVELSTEIDGQRGKVSGFGGESGAIFEDALERGQRSGTLR